ncbi:restriction endonuclease [uncultured Clostridium sp.]|uniref:restriction endonuclease n=1 Tax=uncultured Clostridium sp. TaxID=59620 RepID=UPI0028EC3189|nr:restriction endonuclease [uncultured Clostridium sp.]
MGGCSIIKFIITIAIVIVILIFIIYLLNWSTNDSNNITPRNLFNSDIYTIKSAISDMQWWDFEIFSAKLFALAGDYTYEVTSKTNDKGKDVILRKNGEVVYLECKHQKDKVGRPIAQKLCGAMIADNVSSGIIVTLNGAHKNCLEYCSKLKKSKLATISIDVVNLDDLISECLNLNAYTVYEIAGISNEYINIS